MLPRHALTERRFRFSGHAHFMLLPNSTSMKLNQRLTLEL
jgi:hypothetical protein